MKQQKNQNKSPVHKEQEGLIHASVWENKGKKGKFYTITLTRSYRDGETWKSTHAFGREDLDRITAINVRLCTWFHNQDKKA